MDWLMASLGNTGLPWIQAVLLLGLFWAALVHPQRIRSVFEFRLATLLLGVSLLVPVLLQVFVLGSPLQAVRQGKGMLEPGPSIYTSIITPAVVMLAVLLGVDSVTPRGPVEDD